MSQPPDDVYLVDSSVWIPALRRRGDPALRARVDELLALDAVATTGVIRLELLRGATDAELARLEPLIASVRQLPTEEDDWTEAARIGQTLRRAGRFVPSTDLLIAAIAIRHSAVLLHRDADYEVVAQHTALRTEAHT